MRSVNSNRDGSHCSHSNLEVSLTFLLDVPVTGHFSSKVSYLVPALLLILFKFGGEATTV